MASVSKRDMLLRIERLESGQGALQQSLGHMESMLARLETKVDALTQSKVRSEQSRETKWTDWATAFSGALVAVGLLLHALMWMIQHTAGH